MRTKKTDKKAFSKETEALSEKRQREITDRVLADMLQDIEEEKTKFHFKRTKEKLAREEAEIKRLKEKNKQKLQDLQ